MFLRKQFEASPIIARVVPFVVFLVLTFFQGQFGEEARYWFYLAKTGVGAWLIWEMRPFVSEMRWAFSWEAVVVGIGVCGVWVGLDPFYPKMGSAGTPWNPHEQFGCGSALAWTFIVARFVGSSLIVPVLEEVFYRSFLYRYLINTNFLSVPLRQFHWTALIMTATIFGAGEHREWLAGILCGLAYQWLVFRKGRLGDAMTAHAITNFLLGVWVVWRSAWNFW